MQWELLQLVRQKISIDTKGAGKAGSYQVLLVHNDFA